MKRIGVFLTVLFAGFAVYSAIFSATVRYRLTLEAEVDGELKTGSGVIEITYSKNNDPISTAGFTTSMPEKRSLDSVQAWAICLLS